MCNFLMCHPDELIYQEPQNSAAEMLHRVPLQRGDQVYLHRSHCLTGKKLVLHCRGNTVFFLDLHLVTNIFFVSLLGARVSEELCATHCRRPSKPSISGENRVAYCSGHVARARHHPGYQCQTGQCHTGLFLCLCVIACFLCRMTCVAI